ncbi:MAG: phage portal protein [Patescibacteria group bacterium]|nr:phage portal protein [Patescibacteria group bacterium]
MPPDNSQPALRHDPGSEFDVDPRGRTVRQRGQYTGHNVGGDGSGPPEPPPNVVPYPQSRSYPGATPWHQPQSQYRNQRPTQPPNDVRDVDIDYNWFTPFQPVWPFGPPFVTYPREWDYPTGINLEYISRRQQLYGQLRMMAQSNGILRTVIESRIDHMMRVPWTFSLKDKPTQASKKDPRVQELVKFFRFPDGKRPYDTWARMILDDLLVIDSPCIYRGWRQRNGKPYVLEVLDGATIKPIVDDAGRIPDYPSPAYQQIIKGLPMVNFDETELLYSPMRVRPELPIYGYSPVEQCFMEITQAIRRVLYQTNFWNEGNIPDIWATTPEDWTPTQIAQFQAFHDALYSGTVKDKSKVRFLPGGVEPTPVKGSAGELLKSEYDEWLARIICFAFGIPPTPFIRQLNRSTAKSAADASKSEGLQPYMEWWRCAVMNRIIEEDFGYDDIEFKFLPLREADSVAQATTLKTLVASGIMTVNEARYQLGLPEVPEGKVLIIETGSGGVPLSSASEPPPPPVAPMGGAFGGKPPMGGGPAGGKPAPQPQPQQTAQPQKQPTPRERAAQKFMEKLEAATEEKRLELILKGFLTQEAPHVARQVSDEVVKAEFRGHHEHGVVPLGHFHAGAMLKDGFDPDEPRDDNGRWTSGGGGGSNSGSSSGQRSLSDSYPSQLGTSIEDDESMFEGSPEAGRGNERGVDPTHAPQGAQREAALQGLQRALLADRMMSALKEHGGFTIDKGTAQDVTTGYSVSEHPELSKTFSVDKMQIQDVESWLDKVSPQIDRHFGLGEAENKPKYYVGGWVDKGTVWLDVVSVYNHNQRDQAVEAGKKANQISIADLDAISRGDFDNAFINTGGTGEAPKAEKAVKTGEPVWVLFNHKTSPKDIYRKLMAVAKHQKGK